MLSKSDQQNILRQFQRKIPTLQIVKEFGIANPPAMEQYCSCLPEEEQLPILRKIVKMEAGRIAYLGIKTFEELSGFLGVIECLRKHGWIDEGELDTVVFQVRRWIESGRCGEVELRNESEAALMRLSYGLSHRMF